MLEYWLFFVAFLEVTNLVSEYPLKIGYFVKQHLVTRVTDFNRPTVSAVMMSLQQVMHHMRIARVTFENHCYF